MILTIGACAGQDVSPAVTASAPASAAATAAATESAPRARGYHALVALRDGVWLYGGDTAPPGRGGVSLTDAWTFRRDTGWARLAAKAPASETWCQAAGCPSGVNVYDAKSDRTLVIPGGADFWVYEPRADRWQKRTSAEAPTLSTNGANGTYDVESDRLIMFDTAGTTWSYDLNTDKWKRMAPKTSPPARRYPAMAYHAASDRVVLFGGGDRDDTWIYDFNADTWTEMKPARSPPGRKYTAMTFDMKANRVIVFGGAFGAQGVETPLGDTWAYDLERNTWLELTPVASPSPRGWHAMAYDAASGMTVLFGGGPHRERYQADTWIYDSARNIWSIP